ncbi:MAG: hypothetical protein FJ308_20110 [Planctomycetes bacterium]|nr:hypothetical protein [Planctomycetota bacterium]
MSRFTQGIRIGTLLCIAIAGAVLDSSQAFSQQSLNWKFSAGKIWKVTTTQEISTSINNRPKTVLQSLTMDWKITSVEADGTATIDQVVKDLQVQIDGVIIFDSKSPSRSDAEEKIADRFQSIIGQKITAKHTPRGEITYLDPPEQTPDLLRTQPPESLLLFPEKPISVGSSWITEATRRIDLIGTLKTTNTWQYVGLETFENKPLHRFRVTPSFQLDDESQRELTRQEGSGNVWFDSDKGRIEKSEITQSVDWKKPVADMKIVQKYTTKTTSQFHDATP